MRGNNDRYSEDDDRVLRAMARRGCFAAAIGAAINRSEKSVRARASTLGIELKFPARLASKTGPISQARRDAISAGLRRAAERRAGGAQ